jgi:hypothetical protein
MSGIGPLRRLAEVCKMPAMEGKPDGGQTRLAPPFLTHKRHSPMLQASELHPLALATYMRTYEGDDD